jgi:DNA-binding beta-propeller fold protein YncE
MGGQRVVRIDDRGILHVIGGTGEAGYSGDGGPARDARFNNLHNLAISPDGDLYLSDTWNCCVRKISGDSVATVAGTGENGFGGDGGPATEALFGGVYCVALDPQGERLYMADLDNRRVRVLNTETGVVTTVAGNGDSGVPADGARATASPLVDPRAVAVDRAGRVYILERIGHALRVVEPDGSIRTVVGTGEAGATGDGGDARNATLCYPKHLCIDLDGNVVIADTNSHAIRKYLPREGVIVRVAGTGAQGSAGLDGDPLEAELHYPHGVTVPPCGTLTIADSYNHRVLKIVA